MLIMLDHHIPISRALSNPEYYLVLRVQRPHNCWSCRRYTVCLTEASISIKLATSVPGHHSMQGVRLLQRGSLHCRPLLLHHASARGRLGAPRHHQQLRCMAAAGGSQDKSWGDILSSAAELGSAVVSKAGKSLKDMAQSIMPAMEQRSEQPRPTRVVREESPNVQLRTAVRDAFGGGLTGRLFGSMMSRAVGGMMEGMQQQMEAARDLQEQAAFAIRNSSEVQQRLGGDVQVGDPFSQEQSTISINGRMSQQVRLRMPVTGSRGMAEALVEQQGNDRQIYLQLPGGGRIRVGSGSGDGYYASGRVIDVEAEDVR